MSLQLDLLISRADRLMKTLQPAGDNGDGATDKDVDPFTSLKRDAAKKVEEIRGLIAERDELLAQNPGGTKETVGLSAKVRSRLRELKEDGQALRELHQKSQEKKKGKKITPQGEEDQRAVVVDLVQSHIAECEELERKRFQNGGAARAELAAGISISSKPSVQRTAVVSDLKSLDDPELDKGLQMLAQKDAEIDAQLDELSKGVGRLKDIALSMKTEIAVQNQMIHEITQEVDKVNDHLQNLNTKILEALDNVGGVGRTIVYAILFIILLAIIIYIAQMLSKSSSSSSPDSSETSTPSLPSPTVVARVLYPLVENIQILK